MSGYSDAVGPVLAALAAEHAIPDDPAPSRLDYAVGLADDTEATAGLAIAQLVLDEFPWRDVPKPRDGWRWCERLDEQEVPQYTEMEELVRALVDAYETEGIQAMRRGSLWWLRALHVHPRCRGDQLGARLLAHALRDLVGGPYDVVVLEAHPELTIFAAKPQAPGLANWKTYDAPSVAALEGLARYFARMGFTADDDPEWGLTALRAQTGESDYEVDDTPRGPRFHRERPPAPPRTPAMYAFVGDLLFSGLEPLGRRMLTRRDR
jgi:GNAT superfamily N-acetyltransferase